MPTINNRSRAFELQSFFLQPQTIHLELQTIPQSWQKKRKLVSLARSLTPHVPRDPAIMWLIMLNYPQSFKDAI
jgi:hypothetical protein